jgi:hypothetical protein
MIKRSRCRGFVRLVLDTSDRKHGGDSDDMLELELDD